MTARILIDTNVLVYAHDRTELEKQRRAIEILDRLATTRTGHLSTQVLAEFYNASTRNLSPPLTPPQAHDQIQHFLRIYTIFDMTPQVVLEAIRGVSEYQFNFWDAQIWAVARLNNLSVVFSEDFNVGTTIEGVHFVNPFAAEFDPQSWDL